MLTVGNLTESGRVPPSDAADEVAAVYGDHPSYASARMRRALDLLRRVAS
jgi:hypothetical protein